MLFSHSDLLWGPEVESGQRCLVKGPVSLLLCCPLCLSRSPSHSVIMAVSASRLPITDTRIKLWHWHCCSSWRGWFGKRLAVCVRAYAWVLNHISGQQRCCGSQIVIMPHLFGKPGCAGWWDWLLTCVWKCYGIFVCYSSCTQSLLNIWRALFQNAINAKFKKKMSSSCHFAVYWTYSLLHQCFMPNRYISLFKMYLTLLTSQRGALAIDARGCSLWHSLLERPPPALETRVRDPLGVMLRTRGGLTSSDWANRPF